MPTLSREQTDIEVFCYKCSRSIGYVVEDGHQDWLCETCGGGKFVAVTPQEPNRMIREALTESGGIPVVGAVWCIGLAKDGAYFLSERWDGSDGGGWTSWYSTLNECVDDIRNRIENDPAPPDSE